MITLWTIFTAFAGQTEILNMGTPYTAVWALREGESIVLVDAHNPGKQEMILAHMERAGLDPRQITAIVLTHGHPDHAGSAQALADQLGVPIIAGAQDAPYLSAGTAPLHPTGSRGSLISLAVRKRFPPVVIDVLVDQSLDLSPYGISGEIEVVGGHTPGSLIIELQGGDVLIGDLIRSRMLRHHVPTLHFFHDDPLAAHARLRKAADGALVLYPCHGGGLDADHVEEWLAKRGVHHEKRLRERIDTPASK